MYLLKKLLNLDIFELKFVKKFKFVNFFKFKKLKKYKDFNLI